ncbi:hypothetical protein E8E13_010834 [Curvularia kusanoi]|uniref:Uncharacterized protein n=1 Tax=Curvularia kusanoi TaxID=90978 RepID=A0A9P4TJJ1_CURKU|nr:hypothetical protein E8E13_010834 [Curvularia kusanoi]
MAGVTLVWVADLPESAEEWYEDEYIPAMLSQHAKGVLLGEENDTGLDPEESGAETKEAEWKSLAFYDVEDVQKAKEATYDEKNHPPTIKEQIKNARFDVRSYDQLRRWQNDPDWNGDAADIQSILLWEWKPREGFEKEVLDFYENELGPMFSTSPEILRLRWFKLKDATVLKGDTYQTLEKEELFTYMVAAELDNEACPWDQMFAMYDMPGWVKYYEAQKCVKWQARHYIIKRNYEHDSK